MKSTEAKGRWLPSGIRNMPCGHLTWRCVSRQVYRAIVNGKPVATVVARRSYGRGWVACIPGWVWKVPIGTRSVAATLKRKEVDVGVFPTAPAAKKAVESAYEQLLKMEH